MKFRGILYISGAYRGRSMNDVYENIQHARRAGIEGWKHGWISLVPHLNTQFMDGLGQDEMYMQGDLLLLEKCDAILMLEGYGKSMGATREFQKATDLGLQIFFEGDNLEGKNNHRGLEESHKGGDCPYKPITCSEGVCTNCAIFLERGEL
jgi:hypothetical protein